jgi:inner membrane protein
MPVSMQRGLLVTALIGSQIPDIDVVVKFTEIGQVMEQMWHRGLTHSVFLVPFWALLIFGLVVWLFKVKDRRIFYTALTAVFVHDTIDLFNAWGTGYLEPFSSTRITIGSIPIVDGVFWVVFITGLLITRYKKSLAAHVVFRWVAIVMLAHVGLQTAQGLWLEHQVKKEYEQAELAATFVPGQFQVIGKKGEKVDIYHGSIFTSLTKKISLVSKEKSDLTPLLKKNPRAHVLIKWSPFVVIVDDSKRLGIFDPRFYKNGQSFLSEYINKN